MGIRVRRIANQFGAWVGFSFGVRHKRKKRKGGVSRHEATNRKFYDFLSSLKRH